MSMLRCFETYMVSSEIPCSMASDKTKGLKALPAWRWASLTVVPLVSRLAARGAVPHDEHRFGVGGLFSEAPQHLSVMRVTEFPHGFRYWQPFQVVDFGVGDKLPADGA